MKKALVFVGLMAVLIAGIVAGLTALSMFTGYLATDTPNQAVALGQYVRSSGITSEQAQSAKTLAEADAITRHEQTDRYRAQTERMDAENRRLETIQSTIGFTPGLWLNISILVFLGLLAVFILKRKSKG